jgi:hypothetical protein
MAGFFFALIVLDRKLSSGMHSMEIINGTERRVEKMIVE